MPTLKMQDHADYDPDTTVNIGGITGMVEGDRVYDTTTGIPQYRSAGAAWERFTVVLNGQVAHPVGVVGAPGIVFDGDPDTGIYQPAADVIGFAVGGALVFRVQANGVLVNVNGSKSIPAYNFLTDTNSGIYRHAADQLGITVGAKPLVIGNVAPVGVATGADAAGGNIFLKIEDGGVAAAAGNVGASYTFTAGDGSDAAVASGLAGGAGGNALFVPGDQGSGDGAGADGDLGGFYVGSTTLSPATASPVGPTASVLAAVRNPNATSMRAWIEGGTSSYLYLVNGGGTAHIRIMRFLFNDGAGNPTLSLTSANDFDANQVHFFRCDLAGAFSSRLIIGVTGGSHHGIDGTAASPSQGFITDVDTGIYRPGANQYGITCGTDPIVFSNAAIALAAAADTVGGDIFVKVEDGGTSTGVGRAGASFSLNGGDGSDAAVASGLNGGVGGSLNLVPGDGGAGDGAGVAGADGQVNIGIVGSGAVPSLIGAGDVDTGLWWTGVNALIVATSGADRWVFASGGQLRPVTNGSAASPVIQWNADFDTGIFRHAANNFGITAGGKPVVISNAAITLAAAADTAGGDIFSKVEDGGTASGATAGFDGADLTETAGDGSAAGGGVNVGGDGGDRRIQSGVGGAGAGGGAAGADGLVYIEKSDNTGFWDDLRIVPGAFQFAGASDPTLSAWQPTGAGATFQVYEFDTGDEVFFTCQIPHSYLEGSDLKPHIHWTPRARGVAENGKTVNWRLDYSIANPNANFGASATINLTDTCNGVNERHEVTDSGTISGTGVTMSAMLVCRVYRLAGDSWSLNTAGNRPVLLEFDIHFQTNSNGSRAETSK
jgi:hypothetical protein